MDTLSLRNMILSTPLAEEPVTVTGWNDPATSLPASLLIRELDGKAGADLVMACTDAATQKIDQEALIAGVVLATLRNAEDKALVFSSDPVNKPNEYDPAFRDSLMMTGLGHIMYVANLSIKLSGLDAAAATPAAKNA